MSKNILVTGGAGYIGSVLVPKLLDSGHNVTVYDNLLYGGDGIINNFLKPNFNFIKGDILDKEKLSSAIKDNDVIIHLAAIVGYTACRKDVSYSYKINHEGTKNVVDCLDGQLLLFGSTGSNYGTIEGICTEESPLNPLSIYAKSKTLAEEEVMKYENAIAYRFATAFGISPRLRLDLLVNDLAFSAHTQKYIAVYESHFMRTFIHIQDIANSFLFAINNGNKMKGEVYNVGSNHMNYSKKDVCEMIKSKTNCYVHYADFDGDADKRDYIVSYDKVEKLGYNCTIGIEQGLDELLKVFPIVNINNKYRN